MEYRDIEVEFLQRESSGHWVVRVESEKVSGGKSTFTLPDRPSAGAGAPGNARGQFWSAPKAVASPGAESVPPVAQEVGAALFQALFRGDVLTSLLQESGAAADRTETGVRIRLSMDLRDKGMDEVATQPWELMWWDDKRKPLPVAANVTLVRQLKAGRPKSLRPFTEPLRILVLKSNPKGTRTLDLGAEAADLGPIWKDLGVEVHDVRPVEAEIRQRLAEADFHIVHFMGHGDFTEDEGGALLLEHEDGTPHRMPAADVVQMLQNEPLRLVFLNACSTAATGSHAAAGPFAGLAAALIDGCVPAVVATRAAIADTTAIAFAEVFYQRLTQGLPVDAAMAEARSALYGKHDDWHVPVLYLQSPNGYLFTSPKAPGRDRRFWARSILGAAAAVVLAGLLTLWWLAGSATLQVYLQGRVIDKNGGVANAEITVEDEPNFDRVTTDSDGYFTSNIVRLSRAKSALSVRIEPLRGSEVRRSVPAAVSRLEWLKTVLGSSSRKALRLDVTVEAAP